MTTEKEKAVYTKDIRQFSGATFRIDEVFMDYRMGWYESAGKNLSRTFKKFPITDEKVYVTGTDAIKALPKYSECSGLEYREQIWNDGVAEFHKVDQKSIDTTIFKKVFDVAITLPTSINIIKYVKDGKNVEEMGRKVILQCVSAAKVKDLIRSIVDDAIPMKEGKDRATGEKIMKEVYGFEDEMKELLKGKFCKIKVTGQGMDTKYIYSEGKKFDEEINIEDVPF